MKGKITSGRGLSGLTRYIQRADADTEHIDGSCEPHDFLRTCAALRALRPDVKQAAIHISISMPPGQPLSPDQWRQAGDILRREMDLENCEFQIDRHHNTNHDHAHYAGCKIKPDGTLWNDSHSARRLHKACETIEREMSLQMTLTVEQHRAARRDGSAAKPMSDSAVRQFQRTGEVPNSTKAAIARRIKNERKNADRTTHPISSQRDAGLAVQPPTNPRSVRATSKTPQQPGSRTPKGFQADRVIATARTGTGVKTDRNQKPDPVLNADENAAECYIQPSSARAMPKPFPPSLSGRLRNANSPVTSAYDLFWSGRDRPTFRWHSDSGQVQLLAKPNEKNVMALFDVAKESGLKPPLRIFGTPEFQIMACAEARRIGIEVHAENDRVARSHEADLRGMRRMETYKKEREAADREAEQVRRAMEICASEERKKPTASPTWRPSK